MSASVPKSDKTAPAAMERDEGTRVAPVDGLLMLLAAAKASETGAGPASRTTPQPAQMQHGVLARATMKRTCPRSADATVKSAV